MNLTSNFDFCVELGLEPTREIFHLAFKSEDRYPHNVGPLDRTLAGRDVQVEVRVLDDEDDAAELSFLDEKHVLFSFPFEITVTAADAPDPDLSRVTIRTRVEVPARLATWVEEGEEVLGITFEDVTPEDVDVVSLEGLPEVDAESFAAAIHGWYEDIDHTYTSGTNVLVLYDDARDPDLEPVNEATPYEITPELLVHEGSDYLKVTAPLHVTADLSSWDAGTYTSYGRMVFHREVVTTESTVTLDLGTEPADEELSTVVELDDDTHPASASVAAALEPRAVTILSAFGPITEPAFTEDGARELLRREVAAYLEPRRYPVYSPKSGDPERPVSTPVGFILADDDVLAILLNRRDDSVEDFAPDDFLEGGRVALAAGRAYVDEEIAAAIEDAFPDLDDGGERIDTDEGSATLKEVSVVPSDPGTHGESEGHLWVEGKAVAHIRCWPDPTVHFDGPLFVDATRDDTEEGCSLVVEVTEGDFDVGQSCCDVFIDLIIPIVGWVMLIIVENTIDAVGGELISEVADEQGAVLEPFPPVVNGIALVTVCLTDMEIRSEGFVYPGEITVRRLGRSFGDLEDERDTPRP